MSRRYIVLPLLLSIVAILGTACNPGGPIPTLTPVATATPLPPTLPGTTGPTKAVVIRLSSASNQVAPNDTVQLTIAFEPVIQTIQRRADGSPATISQMRWENSNIAQLRYCVAVRTPCELADTWQPFVPAAQATVTVDWVGTEPLWVVAEFRDANGSSIPGVREDSSVGTQARAFTSLTGMINSQTPDALQPPAIQTLLAPTRQAFPVTGSVKIANSPCCAGGKVGSTVSLAVTFDAHSSQADVTDMRVAFACPRDGASLTTPWESFVQFKTYTATVAINFVGWDIAVQYRDAQGNLSPVYCDDISIEGSP